MMIPEAVPTGYADPSPQSPGLAPSVAGSFGGNPVITIPGGNPGTALPPYASGAKPLKRERSLAMRIAIYNPSGLYKTDGLFRSDPAQAR
jgi:hypothetical protein